MMPTSTSSLGCEPPGRTSTSTGPAPDELDSQFLSCLGRRLLDSAVSYADDHDFARVVLSPSERSIPFYERAGFIPASNLIVRPA